MANKVAGIDFAISTPSVCIIDEEDNASWLFFSSRKKDHGQLADNITGIHYKSDMFNDDIERFDFVIDNILNHLSQNSITYIGLEGYSMGSKSSRLFQIGEATGILKKALRDEQYDYRIYAPTSIKKFATGSGRADKNGMASAFIGREEQDLFEVFDMSKAAKPLEDLFDSYWIARMRKENDNL